MLSNNKLCVQNPKFILCKLNIYPKIPPSNSKLCGKFLGWHWTAAFNISNVFLKHCPAESSISCREGVGPHKQHTNTFGTNVQQTNLKAAYKNIKNSHFLSNLLTYRGAFVWQKYRHIFGSACIFCDRQQWQKFNFFWMKCPPIFGGCCNFSVD